MFAALSKLVPHALSKKDKQRQTTSAEDGDDSVTKPFSCRVILLDDSELRLNVKVRRSQRCTTRL